MLSIHLRLHTATVKLLAYLGKFQFGEPVR
jgi:hypothetical protein